MQVRLQSLRRRFLKVSSACGAHHSPLRPIFFLPPAACNASSCHYCCHGHLIPYSALGLSPPALSTDLPSACGALFVALPKFWFACGAPHHLTAFRDRRLPKVSSLRRWSVARESGLAPWHKDMKAEWLQFLKPDELRNLQKELKVLLQKGTGVNCPAYLISHFLLCKHLVRAAAPLLGDRPA
ncbi:hypothetical protein AURDEDRAFT_132119 [Auricularia subglabra TFB-10046 SS5]|uniref:Uncharacterized protein n=1 Tax=Auricularia subglabra (strain TFB-10046 / SS5) TaxID=717982 RepID=J0WL48_AURST|nr:hypothetical protein AURDEDRAFT_132119 [Auricularia subglabra TFB-10046 SS5]